MTPRSAESTDARPPGGLTPSPPMTFDPELAPAFAEALASYGVPEKADRWVYVPYDQLATAGTLVRDPERTGLVFVESAHKARRRPYHQQKLALLLANMRHFALERAAEGFAIRYVMTTAPYAEALDEVVSELGPLHLMEPAERELRAELATLVDGESLELHPNALWLTTPEEFREFAGERPWRMDRFYQGLRRARGILMDDEGPVGGKYSFDADNRQPWKGDPPAPTAPCFAPDAITEEVVAFVRKVFASHPGEVRPESLPATADDAEQLWRWAKSECLPCFGPYEDAMSTRSRTLFHTTVSGLMNLGRLAPRRVLDDVLALDVPLNSQEGFVRQVLGWREFMRHVHRETDGFRDLPGATVDAAPCERIGHEGPAPADGVDGGSAVNRHGYDLPLPAAYWGTTSGLRCLDAVVAQVMETGFTHHIPRLMVLANLATLFEVHPRELTDWFWAAFVDAYDWVVEPNVIGMGTFATGEVFTTKPYVSGAAYIDRMSDFCGDCAFRPKKTCPITPLYWAYLARHRPTLSKSFRMKRILANLDRRSDEKKTSDAATFERVRAALRAGETLEP